MELVLTWLNKEGDNLVITLLNPIMMCIKTPIYKRLAVKGVMIVLSNVVVGTCYNAFVLLLLLFTLAVFLWV